MYYSFLQLVVISFNLEYIIINIPNYLVVYVLLFLSPISNLI